MATIGRGLRLVQDTMFIEAYAKYFGPTHQTVTVDGVVAAPEDVIAGVQKQIDAESALALAHGEYVKALAARRATIAANKVLYDGAKAIVLVMYKSASGVLAEFGLSPKKKTGPKDTATKKAAAEKGRATRALRHTMGPKQKAKIKGVVPP